MQNPKSLPPKNPRQSAKYYRASPKAIVQLCNRLRWGNYAAALFANHYTPEGIEAGDLLQLEKAVANSCDHYIVSIGEARACSGKHRCFSEQRSKAVKKSRGMEGCRFLFVQRMKAAVPIFRMDLCVVLRRPRYWCLAQSVPAEKMIPCDKKMRASAAIGVQSAASADRNSYNSPGLGEHSRTT